MLVVEDEPLLGQFNVRILEIVGGMEATLATDGIEGLEMAWKWRQIGRASWRGGV